MKEVASVSSPTWGGGDCSSLPCGKGRGRRGGRGGREVDAGRDRTMRLWWRFKIRRSTMSTSLSPYLSMYCTGGRGGVLIKANATRRGGHDIGLVIIHIHTHLVPAVFLRRQLKTAKGCHHNLQGPRCPTPCTLRIPNPLRI